MNNMHKWANSANEGAREAKCDLFDGGEGDEQNVGLVEIPEIFVMNNNFVSFETERFDGVLADIPHFHWSMLLQNCLIDIDINLDWLLALKKLQHCISPTCYEQ